MTWDTVALGLEPVTEASQRLRALASAVASVLPPAVTALAVTGSAARGDASAGSDLDLWAVAAAPAAPLSIVYEGVPTTCFIESASLLEDLTHLATVEAEHLHIVHDPDAILGDARTLARDKYGTLCRAAVSQNAAALAEMHRAPPPVDASLTRYVQHFRDIADVHAVLALLRAGHRAAPRPRTVLRVLGEAAHRGYLRVQGLHDLPPAKQMKAQWENRAAVLEAARATGLQVGAVSAQAVRASAVMRKLEHGEKAEAVIAARHWYRRVIAPARRRASRATSTDDNTTHNALRDDEAFWMGYGADGPRARAAVNAAGDDFARALAERR